MYKRIIPLATVLILLILSQTVQSQNKSLFFVYLNANPDKEVLSEEKVSSLQKAHLDNIDRLHKEGKLLAAGPFDGGGGIFILKAENLAQANEYLNSDPAIQANRFKLEVYPFQFWNGGLCETQEPYEMVTYPFCRINTKDGSTFSQVQYHNRIYFANEYNTAGNILCYAFYKDSTDGFVIFDGDSNTDVEQIMKSHPAVAEGLVDYQISPLWIAKGTFCE